jgi:hypothetical protein
MSWAGTHCLEPVYEEFAMIKVKGGKKYVLRVSPKL